MNELSAIIWNASPELISLGSVTVRWYGLLFALGFFVGQIIMTKIFKQEGKPESDLEVLMLYMIVSTVLGARLGHCLFYEFDYYMANPLEILMVWKGGLASHGATVGILFGLWLYSRNRPGQSYMWILDRIVIVVALGGCFIRLGNLMNSEIIGLPSTAPTAFVFANSLEQDLLYFQERGALSGFKGTSVKQGSAPDTVVNGTTYVPLELSLRFEPGANMQANADFMNMQLASIISTGNETEKHFRVFDRLRIVPGDAGTVTLTGLYGVPRHPSQLYEAISCFLLFVFLYWLYQQTKEHTPEGRIFGAFVVVLFSLRIVYEFFKENQVAFENTLPLNMGQILSIPMVAIGLWVLLRSYRKKNAS